MSDKNQTFKTDYSLSNTPFDPAPSFELPGYKIIERLGKGSMGTVYACEQIKTGRVVAIKVLNPKYTSDSKANHRFEEEAKLVAKLKHPNIVEVYNLINHDDIYYLIMEYCNGSTLSAVSRRNPLNLLKVIHCIEQILSALDYTHKNGIVHHDIKSSNIMMDGEGNPQLCDFGLSSISQEMHKNFEKGSFFGTPNYMSPEKVENRLTEKNEHLSDLFSVGVLFYKLITGDYPFRGEDIQELTHNISHLEPPVPVDIKPDIPLEVNAIILKLLNKNTNKRYQSAQEVLNELRNYESKKTVEAFSSSISYQILLTFFRNWKKYLLLILIIIILAFPIDYVYDKIRLTESEWLENALFSQGFKEHHIEHYGHLFTIKKQTPHQELIKIIKTNNGSLRINESKPLTIIYDKRTFLINSEFEAQITQLNHKKSNKSGLVYLCNTGKAQRGIYFMLNGTNKLTINYPTHDGFEIVAKTIPQFDLLRLSIRNDFPKITFLYNHTPILEINHLFLHQKQKIGQLGLFLNSSDSVISKPFLMVKEAPFSTSPLTIPKKFIYQGDFSNAYSELQRLKSTNLLRTQAEKDQFKSYLSFSLYHLNLYEKFLSKIKSFEFSNQLDDLHLLEKANTLLLSIVKKAPIKEIHPIVNSLTKSSNSVFIFDDVIQRLLLNKAFRSNKHYYLKCFKKIPKEYYFLLFPIIKEILTDLIENQDPTKLLNFLEVYNDFFALKDTQITPYYIESLLFLADSFRKKQSFEKAITYYEKLFKLTSDYKNQRFTVLVGLSECYLGLGDKVNAKAYMEQAAVLNS